MEDLLGLLELLKTDHFLAGLRFGLVALVVGWALRLASGRDKPPLPIAGILIAVAITGSLMRVEETVSAELPALGVILAGAVLARIPGVPVWAQPILVVPGAIWFAQTTPVTELMWVRALIMVMIPAVGFLINDFEKRHSGMGLGVVFYTMAVIGMFLAVPDTEWAVALVAVSVPIAFLAWPKVGASLGQEGAYLAVAVFLWVTAQGGAARPPSILGSAACFGFLILEPVIVALKPSAVRLTTWFNHTAAGAVIASLPQFLVVVLCSRVAARFSIFPPAIAIIVFVYAATIVIALVAAERALRADDEDHEDYEDDHEDELSPGDLF